MLNKITSKFLGLSSLTLFLFSCFITFNWHDSTNPTSDLITSIINSIGLIVIFIWQYAVAHKSETILKGKGQNLNDFHYYQITFCLTILTFILFFILSNINPLLLSTESDLRRGEAFTFKRIYYGVCVLGFIFYMLSVKGPAKLLKSAEHGEERNLGDYFGTFLLMLFPWIGVWFVNPRVKKLGVDSA